MEEPHASVITAPSRAGAAAAVQPLGLLDTVLLAAWIASFTIGMDVVWELKLYDIVGAIGMLRFHRQLLSGMKAAGGPSRGARLLLVAILVGAVVTVARGVELGSLQVLGIRLVRGVSFVAIFLILSRMRLGERDLLRLLKIVYVCAIAQAGIIVAQSVGVAPLIWSGEELMYGWVPTGTLGMNHLNPVLFMTVGVSCAVALLGLRRLWTWWWVVWYSVSVSLMLFAMIRGEARTALVAVAALAVFSLRSRRGVMILTGVLVVGFVVQGRSHISLLDEWDRVWQYRVQGKIQRDSVAEIRSLREIDSVRVEIWRNTARILVTRPDVLLFGAGYQNFLSLRAGGSAAHNIYLHFAAELGLLGVVAFSSFFWGLTHALRRRRRMRLTAVEKVASPALSCVLVLLLVGLFNESFYPSRALFGWMGFCMAYFAVVAHPGWLLQRQAVPSVAAVGAPPHWPGHTEARPLRDRN